MIYADYKTTFSLSCLCIFQQDNAKPHSACITKTWLQKKKVRVLKFNTYIYFDGEGLFQDHSALIHRGQGLTEWFVENEINVKHILWPFWSLTQLDTFGRCWTVMFNSTLHHHRKKIPTEGISYGRIVLSYDH